jgi:hypothetical protein
VFRKTSYLRYKFADLSDILVNLLQARDGKAIASYLHQNKSNTNLKKECDRLQTGNPYEI